MVKKKGDKIMAIHQTIHVPSKYKYVQGMYRDDKIGTIWQVILKGIKATYKTERDAALAVDRTLIAKGKEPINILKRA